MKLKPARVILLPAKSQTYQVVEGGLFINDSREFSWGGLEALKCERVTSNGHAWNGDGIKTYIKHLYIVSDDEIKAGDHWINLGNNELCNRYAYAGIANDAPSCKKVIATTDGSIDTPYKPMPHPSKAFIERFCKEGGVHNVLVGYDQWTIDFLPEYRLHVNQNDTIDIVLIDESFKVKATPEKLYTRAEVVEILHKSLDATKTQRDMFRAVFKKQLDEWIEENI